MLNFAQRRQNAKRGSSELVSQTAGLAESINKLLGLRERITDIIDIAHFEFKGTYVGAEKLSNIFADYKDKHEVINNIYEGIASIVDKLDPAEDNYYFLGERMLLNMESLKNVIKACELGLENVENSKKWSCSYAKN